MKTTTRTELKSFVDDLKTRFLADPTAIRVEAVISQKIDEVIRELWGDRECPDSFALMAIGVVGVAPPRFQGAVKNMDRPALWIPVSARADIAHISPRWLTDEAALALFARLSPGVSRDQAA